MQSVPYHVFVYLFPMQKYLYLGMFLFVNVWTISIHDGKSTLSMRVAYACVGEYFSRHPFINGAANHTVHHLYFNYNYGQYFTLWDRIGGSYRKPTEEQYDRRLKNSIKTRTAEATAVEATLSDPLMKDTTVEYLVERVSAKEE